MSSFVDRLYDKHPKATATTEITSKQIEPVCRAKFTVRSFDTSESAKKARYFSIIASLEISASP